MKTFKLSRKYLVAFFLFAGLATTTFFQNCSRYGFESDGNHQSSQQSSGVMDCSFNGQTVANGQSISAYLNSSVPNGQDCTSQMRTCTNGVLSGTYNFASCSVDAPAACLANGQTIADGQSYQSYSAASVSAGQTCQAISSTCSNGTLNPAPGSYSNCVVDAPKPCSVNGQTIADGQTYNSYADSSVPFGQTCPAPIVSTCNDGVLSPAAGTYSSCAVDAPKACVSPFDGSTIASGQTISSYSSTTVAYGQSCPSATVSMCTNGVFSPAVGAYSSCTAPTMDARCTAMKQVNDSEVAVIQNDITNAIAGTKATCPAYNANRTEYTDAANYYACNHFTKLGAVPSYTSDSGSGIYLTSSITTLTGGGSANFFIPMDNASYVSGGNWIIGGGGNLFYRVGQTSIPLSSLYLYGGSEYIFQSTITALGGASGAQSGNGTAGSLFVGESAIGTLMASPATVAYTNTPNLNARVWNSQIDNVNNGGASGGAAVICDSQITTLDFSQGPMSVILINSTVQNVVGGSSSNGNTITAIGNSSLPSGVPANVKVTAGKAQ